MQPFRIKIVNVRRKTSSQQLLALIDRFLTRYKIAPTTFGAEFGERGLVARLRRGSNMRMDTADRIRLYIATYRPEQTPPKKKRGPKPRVFVAAPHAVRH